MCFLNGHLEHSVYHKPTHADRYLHASSRHHAVQKHFVISSLVHRTVSLFDTNKLQKKLCHIHRTLLNNAFKSGDIKNSVRRHLSFSPNNHSDLIPQSKSIAFLPYVETVTDRICKVLRRNNIFKPMRKISQVLSSPKGSLHPLTSEEVYKISYSCVYIGKTGRSTKTRVLEHQDCVKSGSLQLAVAEHHCTTVN